MLCLFLCHFQGLRSWSPRAASRIGVGVTHAAFRSHLVGGYIIADLWCRWGGGVENKSFLRRRYN